MAILIIIAVIVVISTGFFFAFPSPKKTYRKPGARAKARSTVSKQRDNHYYTLRRMAVKVTPDFIGLKNGGKKARVFGVVVDWYSTGHLVTVAAYQTGDASMYFSSGGGFMGGGRHRRVRRVVFPLIKRGQGFLSRSEKTAATFLPDKDCVGFYLLTNEGNFYAQEKMKDIEKGVSEWRTLFDGAQKVMRRLHQVSRNGN